MDSQRPIHDDAVRAAERILRGGYRVSEPKTPAIAYVFAGLLMVIGVIACLAILFFAWVGSIALGWHVARALGWV